MVVHLYWGHVPAILGWLILETLPEQRLTTSLSAYDIEMAIPLSFEVAQRCNAIRTWSPGNVEKLQQNGIAGSSIEVIHQGIELEHFGKHLNEQRPKVPGRVAAASRLIEEKGVAEAIEIIAQVSKQYPTIHLQVFGEGPPKSDVTTIGRRTRRFRESHIHGPC